VRLSRVAERPFEPKSAAREVVARAVANAVDVCAGPGSVVGFHVSDVEEMFRRRRLRAGDDRRRLQRGQYSYEAELGITCDVDACAAFGYVSNDACLASMVEDLNAASRSGELVDDLQRYARRYNMPLSPFVSADGVVEGSAEWSPRLSSKKKKKQQRDVPTGVFVFLIVAAVLAPVCCLGCVVWRCRLQKARSRSLPAPKREETKDGFELGAWDNPGDRLDDSARSADTTLDASDDDDDDDDATPPRDPFARAALSTARSRRALSDGATRDDYADAAAARADFENHVRNLWERKASKEVAHVSLALAEQERAVADARKRKARRDERSGLEARMAARRERIGRGDA